MTKQKRYRIYFKDGTDKETDNYFFVVSVAPKIDNGEIICITEEKIIFGEDFAPKLEGSL